MPVEFVESVLQLGDEGVDRSPKVSEGKITVEVEGTERSGP